MLIGNDLIIAFDQDQVLNANQIQIQIVKEYKEISAKSVGKYKEYKPIGNQWTASVTQLTTSEAYQKALSYFNEGKLINVIFKLKTTEDPDLFSPLDTTYYQGEAFIESISINSPDGDISQFSINLKGSGDIQKLTYEPPKPISITKIGLGDTYFYDGDEHTAFLVSAKEQDEPSTKNYGMYGYANSQVGTYTKPFNKQCYFKLEYTGNLSDIDWANSRLCIRQLYYNGLPAWSKSSGIWIPISGTTSSGEFWPDIDFSWINPDNLQVSELSDRYTAIWFNGPVPNENLEISDAYYTLINIEFATKSGKYYRLD